jgi:hypothetical protein
MKYIPAPRKAVFLAALFTIGPPAAMSQELPPELKSRHASLLAEGDALVDEGTKIEDEKSRRRVLRSATEKYIAALQILPEPLQDWEECRTTLGAIGNANFLAKTYAYALPALQDAMHCRGAIGNPFLHLRLGQTQFELGNMERAADELARAYLQEGKKIFAGEDPKYLEFVKSKLKPPPGGWPEGF